MAAEETNQRVQELATSIDALALLQELDPSEASFGVMVRLNLMTMVINNLAKLCADQQRQLNALHERVPT